MFQTGALSDPQPINIALLFEIELPRLFSSLETSLENLPSGIEGYTEVLENGDAQSAVSLSLYEEAQWDLNTRRRLRSTLGHECGHIICHVPQWRKATLTVRSDQKKGIALVNRKDILVFQDPEWQAHALSGALLMPASAVVRALGKRWSQSDLADAFDVHPAFVRARLKALRML